jgi:hypothetical protein
MKIWAFIGGMALTVGRVASAGAEPARRLELSASLLAGVGASGRFQDSTQVHYGLGYGGRAGVTLPALLYLGASFVHFRGSDSRSNRVYTNTLDAEVGYEFRLLRDLITIRPQLALGVVQGVTIQSDNAGYPLGLHAAPGLWVGLRLRPLLISAEVRRDFVFDESWPDATTLLLGMGVVF